MQKLFLEKLTSSIQRRRLLVHGDKALIALSGGPDSVALLYSLHFLKEQYALTLAAIHIHHGIRGKEADKDAEFSQKISEKYGIPFYLEKINVPEIAKREKISLELAGRQSRYSIFRNFLQKLNFCKVATGHHLDDQAETILMRIIRGSGSTGLAGIVPIRENIFIRPLLSISKTEILKMLKEEGLQYREDSSNLDSSFFRNKVRKDIMPRLFSCNPEINKRLEVLSEIISSESDFIRKEAHRLFPEINCSQSGKIAISIKKLAGVHVALKRMVIREAAASISENLPFSITEEAINLLSSPGTKSISIKGASIIKTYDRLIFLKNSYEHADKLESILPLSDGLVLKNLNIKFNLTEFKTRPQKLEKGKMTACLDLDKAKPPFFVRKRKDGDRFRPFGMRGKKKLKDFFRDEKIPKNERDLIPLIVDSNDDIIWVVGLRLSDMVKITEKSSNFMEIRALKL